MDYENFNYEKFKKEYESFELYMKEYRQDNNPDKKLSFSKLEGKHSINDAWLSLGNKTDRVNSPSHYTGGRIEAIDIIEDTIASAPDAVRGALQAQVLKYILRLWLKDNPFEDAQKARWYLDRLIDKLNSAQ